MSYIQAQIINRTVYLTLADVPALGIPYTAVTVEIKKANQATLTPWTLTAGAWTEMGNGLYNIQFAAIDTNVVGDFTFTLTSSYFDNFLYDEFTIEPPPSTGNPIILPTQCVVSGTIINQMALAPSNQPLKVTARPALLPAVTGGAMIAGDIAWTFVDAYGNWSLPLIQNSVVIVEIERTGVRVQITVPATSSANFTDLMPAITPDYSL